ncbi:MAG: 30S ribosomal protein S17 [Brevinema sp.]
MKTTIKKTLMGVVVSDKMQKSRGVEVITHEKHPLYGKYVPKRKKFMVHDENNISVAGDKVLISEATPTSKFKRWALVEVIEKHRD